MSHIRGYAESNQISYAMNVLHGRLIEPVKWITKPLRTRMLSYVHRQQIALAELPNAEVSLKRELRRGLSRETTTRRMVV